MLRHLQPLPPRQARLPGDALLSRVPPFPAFPAFSRPSPDKPVGPQDFNEIASSPASEIGISETEDPSLSLHK
jgi:hypothetical protein